MADNRESDGRFKPGVSPNPGGRPKAQREYQEWLLEHAHPLAKERLLEMLNAKHGEKALIFAVGEVNNRLFGKSPQAVVGEDGKPLSLDLGLAEVVKSLTK